MGFKAIIAVFLVLFAITAQAATVTLNWDLNTEPNIRYKVYQGSYSGNTRTFAYVRYTTVVKPPMDMKVSATQKWFFRVTAMDDYQESLFSNFVQVYFIRTPSAVKYQRIDIR